MCGLDELLALSPPELTVLTLAQADAGRRLRLGLLTTAPLRQPSALSVPNSRTRRPTAAMVSRLAMANAAIRTAIASHRPSSLARLAVLDSEPVTALARLEEVLTVADGTRAEISCCTAGISAELAAAT